jgi:hypothetical protein
VSVPVPDFIKLPDPVKIPEKVFVEFSTSMSPCVPKLTVPIPERLLTVSTEVACEISNVEPDPTVKEEALLTLPLPETARVPPLTLKAPV